MYPHERSLVEKLADKPFALIGVNSDRDLDSLKKVLEEEKITWRSFWNGPKGTSGPISTAWNVSGWPTLYILDAEGKIRFKNVRGTRMDSAIETLLAEMGHENALSEPPDDANDAVSDESAVGEDDS